MRYAIPGGVLAGAATFTTYLVARQHYSGPGALDAETSAATLTLFLISMWVLAIIARPYTWWRVALVATMGLGFVVAAGGAVAAGLLRAEAGGRDDAVDCRRHRGGRRGSVGAGLEVGGPARSRVTVRCSPRRRCGWSRPRGGAACRTPPRAPEGARHSPSDHMAPPVSRTSGPSPVPPCVTRPPAAPRPRSGGATDRPPRPVPPPPLQGRRVQRPVGRQPPVDLHAVDDQFLVLHVRRRGPRPEQHPHRLRYAVLDALGMHLAGNGLAQPPHLEQLRQPGGPSRAYRQQRHARREGQQVR